MPDHLFKWRRRLFASVDVAGSTAFKQRSPEDSGRWAYIFKLFFDEFPTTLRACFDEVGKIADRKPPSPLSVWKFVGDEILFSVEIERHDAVAYHAVAFRNAINRYTSEQLKAKPQLAALSLKGTMWGAGFPVSNVEVAPKLGDGASAPQDYLGPCVDQGFRLCSLADSRRIPLSVDVAYMLATTTFHEASPVKIQCEEPKPHKGVPLPYPHIWMDRLDGKESEEDKILGRRAVRDPSSIKAYLEELYLEKRPGLFKPFLVSDPSALFSAIPPQMEENRNILLHNEAEQTYSAKEPKATAKPGKAPPTPKLPPKAARSKQRTRRRKSKRA
jgi:hypothetical protein